jgi:hypothetical protein
VGILISKINRVIAMANTPSLKKINLSVDISGLDDLILVMVQRLIDQDSKIRIVKKS